MSYQREYQQRLRIGLVGVGSHAYRNILPALHHLPVELVALCDLDERLAAATAREYGVSAVFTESARMYAGADLDAVLLCVGPQLHPALAIEAMAAGKHVWMEKPPGMRAADIERIIAARGDRVCAVGFKKAYTPAAQKAKELLALPEFGPLRSLLAVYPMTMPRNGQQILDSGAYCNWLANGCHPLSLLLSLGGEVRDVTTLLGPGEQAVGCVFLRFANGAVGTFHLAGGAPAGGPVERYSLWGAGRSITIDNSVSISYNRGIPFDYQRQVDFTALGLDSGSIVWEANHNLATLENKALFIQGIVPELHDFCAAILDARPLALGSLEFAAQVMRVYEAALVSDGATIAISSANDADA